MAVLTKLKQRSAAKSVLSAQVAAWCEELTLTYGLPTAKAKLCDIRQLAAFMSVRGFGQEGYFSLTIETLKAWVNDMQGQYKPNTVNRKLATLLEYGQTEFDRTRAAVMIELGLSLGFRVFEMRALQLRQINFKKFWIENFRRKSNRYSSKPIPARLRRALIDYLPQRAVVLGRYGALETLEYPLLISVRGAFVGMPASFQISLSAIRRTIKEVGRAAGINDCRPHRLRHSFCKLLSDKTHDVGIVAQMADHSTPQITMRYITASRKEIEEILK